MIEKWIFASKGQIGSFGSWNQHDIFGNLGMMNWNIMLWANTSFHVLHFDHWLLLSPNIASLKRICTLPSIFLVKTASNFRTFCFKTANQQLHEKLKFEILQSERATHQRWQAWLNTSDCNSGQIGCKEHFTILNCLRISLKSLKHCWL